MNNTQLENKLNSFELFKKIFKGFGILYRSAKREWGLYNQATNKKVVPMYTIMKYEYEERFYMVYAFSPKGEIGQEQLAMLKERAEAKIDLGIIRYECIRYNTILGVKEDLNKDGVISNLCNDIEDIYLIADTRSDSEYSAVEWTLSCDIDGEPHCYPLTEKVIALM